MTFLTGNKAPEGNEKLVFGEKEDVFFFAGLGIAVIYAEDTFYDQSQIIAYYMLHVEEVAFFYLAQFPEG